MRLAVGIALVGALACGADVADARRAAACQVRGPSAPRSPRGRLLNAAAPLTPPRAGAARPQSARCSSVHMVFLEMGASAAARVGGPDTWAASLERASAVPQMAAAGGRLVEALQESGKQYVEQMAEYNKRVELTRAAEAAAADRRDRAIDGIKSAKQLIDHLREQITEAELRLKSLRDPAPRVPTHGNFRLYFEDPEVLAQDDKKVVATVLKKQHPHAANLTCLCKVNKDMTGSTVGPVLGGIECDCQEDKEPELPEGAQPEDLGPEEEEEEPAAPEPEPLLRRPSAHATIQVGDDRVQLHRANVIHIVTKNHGDRSALPPEVDIRIEGKGLRPVVPGADADAEMSAMVTDALRAAGLAAAAPAEGDAAAEAGAATDGEHHHAQHHAHHHHHEEEEGAGAEAGAEELSPEEAEARAIQHAVAEVARASGEQGRSLADAISSRDPAEAERIVADALRDVLHNRRAGAEIEGSDAAAVAARAAIARVAKTAHGSVVLDPRAMVKAVLEAQQATLIGQTRHAVRLAHEERVAEAHAAIDDALAAAQAAAMHAATGPVGNAVDAVEDALAAARAVAGATGLDELIAQHQVAEMHSAMNGALMREPVVSATGLDLVQHEHEVRLRAAQAAVEKARQELSAVYSLRARMDASQRVKQAAFDAAQQAVEEATKPEPEPEAVVAGTDADAAEAEAEAGADAMQFIATEAKLVANSKVAPAAAAKQRPTLRRTQKMVRACVRECGGRATGQADESLRRRCREGGPCCWRCLPLA